MTFLNLFLFILQIVVAIFLILIVLIQSSDEDALSGIGAGAGKPSFLSHKTSVDLVTKTTIFLGIFLMLNSFMLASISTHSYKKEKNIVKDYIEQNKDILENETNNSNSVNKNVSNLNK